jgi:hypothetical protein
MRKSLVSSYKFYTINEEISWKEVNDKKGNWNRLLKIMLSKQQNGQLLKLMPATFEELEEEFDNISINARMDKTLKPFPIFVARIDKFLNFCSLSYKTSPLVTKNYK